MIVDDTNIWNARRGWRNRRMGPYRPTRLTDNTSSIMHILKCMATICGARGCSLGRAERLQAKANWQSERRSELDFVASEAYLMEANHLRMCVAEGFSASPSRVVEAANEVKTRPYWLAGFQATTLISQ